MKRSAAVIALVILLCAGAYGLSYEIGVSFVFPLVEPDFDLGLSFGLGSEVFTAGLSVTGIAAFASESSQSIDTPADALWTYSGTEEARVTLGGYARRSFYPDAIVGFVVLVGAGAIFDSTYSQYWDANLAQRWYVLQATNWGAYIGGGVGIRIVAVEIIATFDSAMRIAVGLNFSDLGSGAELLEALEERSRRRGRLR